MCFLDLYYLFVKILYIHDFPPGIVFLFLWDVLRGFLCELDKSYCGLRHFVQWKKSPNHVHVGLGTEFCSEKIPRNRLWIVYVIPQKKVLIPRHFEVHGRVNSEVRYGTELRGKKFVLQNRQSNWHRIESVFSSEECSGKNSESFFDFCATVRNSEHFSLLRNGSEWNS